MASEAADDVASTGGQSFESAAASTGIAGGQQGAAGEQGAPSHHSLGNGSATGITKPKMGGVTFCDNRRVAYTGGIPLAEPARPLVVCIPPLPSLPSVHSVLPAILVSSVVVLRRESGRVSSRIELVC